MSNYTVLHCHTEQSLLDSCTNYKLYVDKCVEFGQKAIAFTEHGNTNTWIEKKMYCDKKGVKFIFGVECYLTETLNEKVRDNYHTILLAKNYDGVKEINRLMYNATQDDHFYYKPRISFDEFLNISDNVIKISACLASPLNGYRLQTHSDDRLFAKYDYYEIQPHNNDEQKDYNIWLVEKAKQYNKPLVATGDFHSSDDYKAECRKVFQLGSEAEFSKDDDYDLTYKNYDDFKRAFETQGVLDNSIILEALENTNVIANVVEPITLDTSFKYPILYGDKDEEVLMDTLRKKYSDKVKSGIIDTKNAQQYADNINEEMRVFKKVGMTGFMLFMSEMITWCWENNIPVGFCRGSCGGSTVAYLSDIIDVDPIKWHTIFSRFCNEDRVEIGDIDIDVSPDQRDLVYDYIINRFGKENTAFILANGTVVDKGTIDVIGKAFRIKWNREHNLNDKYTGDDNPYNLSKIKQIKDEYELDTTKAKEQYSDIFYYFDGILNTIKSQSMHPAGILASPVNLVDEYGCFNKDGKNVICINMEECHEVSLVKYDILSLRNIQVIRDTCRYANIPYPKSHLVNWEDKDVWEHICDSPVGIFQFESQYASECLKKMHPTKINDMSMANAALRPSGESYRNRLFAGETNHNPSEQIDELLKDNRGFLCIEENQLVATANGLIPIKDVNKNDMVYTTKGLERVNNVFDNGQKEVYKLSSKYGEVICTDNHKILTENGWKEYKDIQTGECIAHYVGTLSNTDYNKHKLRLIGWTLGDGTVSGNNIGFVNRNERVVNAYKNCIENIWSNLTVSIKDVKSRVNKLPLYRCNVKWVGVAHNYDKPIHYYFDEINLRGKKARQKEIPNFVFTLDRDCLLTFLGAYTDTDSCLRKNTIMYKTASNKLCNGLVEVLRLIGYSSVVTYDKVADAYNIGVFGGNELIKELAPYCIKIQENIDMTKVSQRKHRLGNVSSELLRNILKNKGITLKEVQKKSGNSLYYSKYITVETFAKICNDFNLETPIELSPNIHYHPVVEKTAAGISRVFDLEINNTHNFVAGGIVVHNCFQEDTIKFLQNICGLSGSEADNVRRAIGRKQIDRLQKALPQILEGYCNKSDKPREIAEQEARTFLQIIEDSSNYQFGYNHSTGYSMIGYVCAYLRYYYPLEFCTSLLNNAGNDEDLANATELASSYGISILSPKFGKSKAQFFMDKEHNSIYKGVGSIKDMNAEIADNLYNLSQSDEIHDIFDILCKPTAEVGNRKQLRKLIKIGYFEQFGDINTLLYAQQIYDTYGKRKTLKKPFEYNIEGLFAKETEKQYSGIDNIGICKVVLNSTTIPKLPKREGIAYQLCIMGYSSECIPDEPINHFAVQSLTSTKYNTFLRLYRLYDGETIEVKVDKKYFESHPIDMKVFEKEFDKVPILKCSFTSKQKRRKIDDKWVATGEYESILSAYTEI